MTTASKIYLHHLETIESFAFASEEENEHVSTNTADCKVLHTHAWFTCDKQTAPQPELDRSVRLALGRSSIWPGSGLLVPVCSDGLIGSRGDVWPGCGFWRSDISRTRPCDGQAEEVLQRLSHLPWTDVVNRMSWSLEHNRRKQDMEGVITVLHWNNLNKSVENPKSCHKL